MVYIIIIWFLKIKWELAWNHSCAFNADYTLYFYKFECPRTQHCFLLISVPRGSHSSPRLLNTINLLLISNFIFPTQFLPSALEYISQKALLNISSLVSNITNHNSETVFLLFPFPQFSPSQKWNHHPHTCWRTKLGVIHVSFLSLNLYNSHTNNLQYLLILLSKYILNLSPWAHIH